MFRASMVDPIWSMLDPLVTGREYGLDPDRSSPEAAVVVQRFGFAGEAHFPNTELSVPPALIRQPPAR
jgi:hypothetical protein